MSRKGRWVGIHTQRVKTAGLCVGLAVKFLSRVIVQMVLENSHLTSQRLHAVFKYDLFRLALMPKQLDHKFAQNDRVQPHLQAGAGKPHVGYKLKVGDLACILFLVLIMY